MGVIKKGAKKPAGLGIVLPSIVMSFLKAKIFWLKLSIADRRIPCPVLFLGSSPVLKRLYCAISLASFKVLPADNSPSLIKVEKNWSPASRSRGPIE